MRAPRPPKGGAPTRTRRGWRALPAPLGRGHHQRAAQGHLAHPRGDRQPDDRGGRRVGGHRRSARRHRHLLQLVDRHTPSCDSAARIDWCRGKRRPQSRKRRSQRRPTHEGAGRPRKTSPLQEGRAWYVIHTYSGYENKVKTNLEHRIESMDAQGPHLPGRSCRPRTRSRSATASAAPSHARSSPATCWCR